MYIYVCRYLQDVQDLIVQQVYLSFDSKEPLEALHNKIFFFSIEIYVDA